MCVCQIFLLCYTERGICQYSLWCVGKWKLTDMKQYFIKKPPSEAKEKKFLLSPMWTRMPAHVAAMPKA